MGSPENLSIFGGAGERLRLESESAADCFSRLLRLRDRPRVSGSISSGVPADLVAIEAEIGVETLQVVTVVGIVVIGGMAIVVVGSALVLAALLVFFPP